jgi:phage FluMu protein Com
MEKRCPNCQHVVRIADNAAADLMLKCPACGRVNMLQNYQELIAVAKEVEQSQHKCDLPKLVDVVSARKYPLTVGKAVVGRMRPGSQAQVQVATDNNYVSRNQFYIEVLNLNGRYKTCISSHEKASNKTMVGDDVLCHDDVMVLNDGDIINICGFELRYEI